MNQKRCPLSRICLATQLSVDFNNQSRSPSVYDTAKTEKEAVVVGRASAVKVVNPLFSKRILESRVPISQNNCLEGCAVWTPMQDIRI